MKPRLHNGNVRATVLCTFSYKDKILISEGYDSVKNEKFHRLLGGGIEFGEKSDAALKREMIEELGAGIKNLEYLGMIENIFEWEGNPGHEILIIYDAEFEDENFYKIEFPKVLDRDNAKVYWKKLSDFYDKKDILYPQGLIEFIENKQ